MYVRDPIGDQVTSSKTRNAAGYAVSVEVHSSVAMRIRNATLISRKWSIVTGKNVDVALTE